MTTLFLVFCYVCGFLVLAIGSFLAATLAFDTFWLTVERIQDQGARKERGRVANQIITDSWWFSESKEANAAMKIYGQNMRSGSGDISTIREEWRKEIAGAKNV